MSEIQRLREIVSKLRAPGGCPWDQKQTHHSLAACLIEETSETLEAIDNHDYELMKEELGDLLLQIVFHSLLAEEKSKFDLEDVARGIKRKLIRRHPHVFDHENGRLTSAEEVSKQWEKIKAQEKKDMGFTDSKNSIFKNLPPLLPALLYANEIYKQAKKAKLQNAGDWDAEGLKRKLPNLNEEEAGKALFELVGACREAKIDPESALRRFASRQVEKLDREVKKN